MDEVRPIENPLEALQMALAFSSRDWATEKRDAWIYGIVLGWDDDCYPEFNRKFGWGKKTFERIQRLHVKFEALCRLAPENKATELPRCDRCEHCTHAPSKKADGFTHGGRGIPGKLNGHMQRQLPVKLHVL